MLKLVIVVCTFEAGDTQCLTADFGEVPAEACREQGVTLSKAFTQIAVDNGYENVVTSFTCSENETGGMS